MKTTKYNSTNFEVNFTNARRLHTAYISEDADEAASEHWLEKSEATERVEMQFVFNISKTIIEKIYYITK